MGVFFGTDGLRGKFNDDLSFSIIYNCGNALGSEIFGAKTFAILACAQQQALPISQKSTTLTLV